MQDPSDQCKILWDDRVGSPTFHKISRFKISVLLHVLHCVAQKRSGGHEVMFVLHLPCKTDVHVPFLATWTNASTMRQTRGTTITSSRPNQPMPRKAAQLNHIDRCDRTLHTLPATPSPPPRSLENYFVEKYLKRM